MSKEKKKYRPEAFLYIESYDGCFTLHCYDKKNAHKVMKELMFEEEKSKGSPFYKETIIIDIEKIDEQISRNCTDCGFHTIDSDSCMLCDKTFKTKGRRTFTYNF